MTPSLFRPWTRVLRWRLNRMEEKMSEETGLGPIPWTVGDIVKGSALIIAIVIVIAFGLGIGTVLLIGPELQFELGSQNITITEFIREFIDLLAGEGVLQLWLIIVLVAMVVAEGAMPLAAWLFSSAKYKCGWQALGFRPFKVRNGLILAAVVAVVGLLISYLYEMLMTSLGMEPTSPLPPELTQGAVNIALFSIVAVVVAPFAEETFFRGFLFTGIGNRYGYGWGAVISALIFSVVHMQLGALLPIFIFGLFLAWLYMRTGSIWVCIFAHGAFNSIALLFMI